MSENDHSTIPWVSVTARGICQVLREVTFGRRLMVKFDFQTQGQVFACQFLVAVDGWRITFFTSFDTLDYCGNATISDGPT